MTNVPVTIFGGYMSEKHQGTKHIFERTRFTGIGTLKLHSPAFPFSVLSLGNYVKILLVPDISCAWQ